MIFASKSVKETQKIATDLVKKLQKFKSNEAVVIALEGELGAGKTVFVKGLAKGLGIIEKIKSPTFVLMKKYEISKTGNWKLETGNYFYHLDCYRLRDENDLINLGIKEIFQESHNIVVVEWSDRIKKILPKKHIKIHIDHISAKERKISIKI